MCRALRIAQSKTVDEHGNPTFPVLHRRDELGRPGGTWRASIDAQLHTVASRALLAGERADEIAFLLGHRDANVTRAVYTRELADARRRSMRRSRILAEFAELFRS
jgi:integrase